MIFNNSNSILAIANFQVLLISFNYTSPNPPQFTIWEGNDYQNFNYIVFLCAFT